MITKTIQFTQLKTNIEQVMNNSERHGDQYLVKRGDLPVGWIVSPDLMEAIVNAAESNAFLWQQMSEHLAGEIHNLCK